MRNTGPHMGAFFICLLLVGVSDLNHDFLDFSGMLASMRLTQLQLTTFRNIEAAKVVIPACEGGQVVALIGPNGAGKTSVLEALSLLSPGRGLHKATPEEMAQDGIKSWGLHATFVGGGTVGQAWQQDKRLVKLDGVAADKQADLASVGAVQWLTPRMDRLFLDGAAARRDFLDRLVFALNPGHATAVNEYKHHLRQRLQLLKHGGDEDWLALEEHKAAELGVKILQARQAYLELLATYMTEVKVQLSGATLGVLQEEDPVAALAGKFQRSRGRDAEVGATHTGAQKVDVSGALLLPEREVGLDQASSGQHKRALVAIMLAHARLVAEQAEIPPLMLIDEVTAHLDEARRDEMLQALLDLGSQVWVSETEASKLGRLTEVVFIAVENGILTLKS